MVIKNYKAIAVNLFAILCLAALFSPFMMFQELAFPFITSKTLYFRILVETALPLYVFLLISQKELSGKYTGKFFIFAALWAVIFFISAWQGVNFTRSLWGNFERMGGLIDFLHLVLFAFYIKALCEINIETQKQGLLAGAFISAVLLSLLFYYFKFGTISSITAGFIISAVGFLSVRVSQAGKDVFVFGMASVGGLVSIVGIFGKLGWEVFMRDSSLPDRVSATFGNPIFFASFLILPMALALYGVFEAKAGGFVRYYYLSAAVFMFAGIILSGTRGAFVALTAAVYLAALAYWFLQKLNFVKTKGLIFGGALLACGVIFLGAFVFSTRLPEGPIKRIFTLNDSNAKSRILQWEVALKGFHQKPFFGTGPENYYVIANKYFDTRIYQYDQSWFDKPHNYFLEVLVTQGIVGFLAYLAAILSFFYALWKGYKSAGFTVIGFCILLAGFLAYNIQNLFVFDTPGASIAFFSFLGFAWGLFKKGNKDTLPQRQKLEEVFPALGWFAIIVILAGSVYSNYFVNFLSVEAARAVGYGNAVKNIDYKLPADYFRNARNLPFNYDKLDTAMYFADYAAGLPTQTEASNDGDFIKNQIAEAESFLVAQLERYPNYPLAWLKLANLRMMDDLFNKRPVGEKAENAIKTGINLAPKRMELWQFSLQIAGHRNDWPKGLEIAKKVEELNPYRPQLKMQLAIAYQLNGQEDDAVRLAEDVIAGGYKLMAAREGRWLVNIYFKRGEYAKAAPLLERMQVLEPDDFELLFLLAQSYGRSGQKDKAILIAQMIKKLNPSFAPQVDEFIKSLQ